MSDPRGGDEPLWREDAEEDDDARDPSDTAADQRTPVAPQPEADDAAQRLAAAEQALLGRWPESDVQPSLERIAALVDLLGAPQQSAPVILVTGTNGKTSTTRMIDALLRGLGLRVGRFTSPHLHSIRERIAVNGEPLSAERFAATYEEVAPYVDLVDARLGPPGGTTMSYFEVVTGMAYAAFADAPVDVAVVEVGMGGTWDATNVADAQVAVVTPVAIDHTRFLGDTVGEIAREKAGIIAKGAVAVLATQPLEAAHELLRRAGEVEASVAREGLEFGVRSRSVALGGQLLSLQGLGGRYDEVFLPLHGAHQAANAAVALAAVEAFLGRSGSGSDPVGGGDAALDLDAVRSAFAGVTSPGRLEVVRRSPTVLLDAAHNPAGAQATAAAVGEAFSFTRLVAVVAIFEDKDAAGILEALEPVAAEIVVTASTSPRALPADDLAALAVDVFGAERVEVVPRLDDAIDAAVRLAEEAGDLGGAGVLVTGSIFTVAEARTLLGRA